MDFLNKKNNLLTLWKDFCWCWNDKIRKHPDYHSAISCDQANFLPKFERRLSRNYWSVRKLNMKAFYMYSFTEYILVLAEKLLPCFKSKLDCIFSVAKCVFIMKTIFLFWERETRIMLKESKALGVNVIGPATVGGIFPGRFKIGNTGGMLSNQLASKLYRHGSVAYVSRSGGLSNELNNIISSWSQFLYADQVFTLVSFLRCTDGVRAGIAIGGDRYPITTYMDHFIKYII